jgi:hypothetical protein
MSVQTFLFKCLLLSAGSLQVLMFPQIMALLLFFVLGLVITIMRYHPLSSEKWHGRYWLVFTQLLFFPATVAVGVLFPASTPPNPHANVIGERWLDALWYGSLATSCFWVFRMKGLRWFAASLVGLLEVFVLSAGFVAGMTVSGDWL